MVVLRLVPFDVGKFRWEGGLPLVACCLAGCYECVLVQVCLIGLRSNVLRVVMLRAVVKTGEVARRFNEPRVIAPYPPQPPPR